MEERKRERGGETREKKVGGRAYLYADQVLDIGIELGVEGAHVEEGLRGETVQEITALTANLHKMAAQFL